MLSKPGLTNLNAQVILAIFLSGLLPMPTALASENLALASLKKMSLEDLMNVEITIASKTPKKVNDTAAAVYVITQDDIRQMGATSIPEALRGVPGLQVARIDANKWAVSIRGMNSLTANKLLVMIDGRSIYNPFSSSVNWDIQDTLLEDIQRIEVIRGPGASIWGANAVNGVINIITKNSADTQRLLLTTTAGTEQTIVTARYGDTLMDKGHYRIFAKYRNQDNGVFADGSKGSDGGRNFHSGFRIDWQHDDNTQLTLNGNLYQSNRDTQLSMLTLQASPASQLTDFSHNVWGANIQAHWSQTLDQQARQEFRFYYDFEDRESWFGDSERGIVDLNYQYSFPSGKRHELTVGIGYRYRYDYLPLDELTQIRILFKKTRRQDHLLSAFIQDQITLLENSVWLTLGSKFEHNSYTGFEIQPSARLSWRPADKQLVWAAISRATRTPARWEHDSQLLTIGSTVGGAVPIIEGNPNFNSETLIAYELGYRFELNRHLQLDFALFYHDYDDLPLYKINRVSAFGQNDSLTALIASPKNLVYGESYGAEIAINWQPNPQLRIRGSYTFIDIQLHSHASDDYGVIPSGEGSTPEHQASLQSSYQLFDPLTLNFFARYVGQLSSTNISDYVNLDIGLEWKPAKNLALSLYARDLLESEHLEFIENSLNLSSTQAERQAYLKFNWNF